MQNICIISSFNILNVSENIDKNFLASPAHESNDKSFEVSVYKTKFEKCLRCWQYKKEVKLNNGLCNRCKLVVNNT